MPRRDQLKRNLMRSQIAHTAAKLMAEDGVQDYASAKQKAARQLNAIDTQSLPDNKEIDDALREYQSIFKSDSQPEILRTLRDRAVTLMRELHEFNPYLVGSVLAGTATEHSDINLQLFCDSVKDLEIYFINQNRDYKSGFKRNRLGDKTVEIPTFTLDVEDTQATLSVYDTDDLRIVQKFKADGRVMERAKLAQVEALLDNEIKPVE
ncbi:MAG: UDP-N-acetylmuramate--alanine ligase [Burkholderiales bacterium]